MRVVLQGRRVQQGQACLVSQAPLGPRPRQVAPQCRVFLPARVALPDPGDQRHRAGRTHRHKR